MESEQQVRITSVEDTILVMLDLVKLEWYRLGHELSDRQWHDIIGVMRVQNERLDLNYLQRTARELGVEDLLASALREQDSPPLHPRTTNLGQEESYPTLRLTTMSTTSLVAAASTHRH
jgi:hypothetical protein